MPKLKTKKLNDRHRRAIQLTLQGWRKKDICKEMGIHYTTLKLWQNIPAFKEKLTNRRNEGELVFDRTQATGSTREEAKALIEGLAIRAARVLENGLDSTDRRIQLDSADKAFKLNDMYPRDTGSKQVIVLPEKMLARLFAGASERGVHLTPPAKAPPEPKTE